MYELNLLLPDIGSNKYTLEEKFKVLKGYLTELNETLSVALSSIDSENLSNALSKRIESAENAEGLYGEIKKEHVFSKKLEKETVERLLQLKSEIIATADEIEHGYTTAIETTREKIELAANEKYTAKSDFGEYMSQTDTKIEQNASGIALNSASIEEAKANLEEVKADIDKAEAELEEYKIENRAEIGVLPESIISEVSKAYLKKSDGEELEKSISSKITQTATDITESFSVDVSRLEADISSVGGSFSEYISSLDAYIRRGELAEGVFGIEIGRSDSSVKARFTNDKLSFLQGDCEVAYISGSNLYITRAQVLDYLEIGNSADGFFTFDVTENGLEVRWSYGS